jgi:hypothetical protein
MPATLCRECGHSVCGYGLWTAHCASPDACTRRGTNRSGRVQRGSDKQNRATTDRDCLNADGQKYKEDQLLVNSNLNDNYFTDHNDYQLIFTSYWQIVTKAEEKRRNP